MQIYRILIRLTPDFYSS